MLIVADAGEGAGEERPSGLERGRPEEPYEAVLVGERNAIELRCPAGGVAKGRCLSFWPNSKYSTFGDEFHRGLLSARRIGRCGRSPVVGVAEVAYGAGEAPRELTSRLTERDIGFLRGIWVEPLTPGGMIEFRLAPPLGRVALLNPMLLRLLEAFMPGDISRLTPFDGPKMTDDAGELPGVPTALPTLVADLSIDTMLEIESRSC